MTSGTGGVKLVVLAGGQSRRMGRDKALLRRPDGETFLEGIVRAAGASWPDIWISGPPRPGVLAALPHLPDALADAGPAAGILAALVACGADVAVAPVDAAAADARFFAWMRQCHERWAREQALLFPHGWIAWSPQGPEPTFGTWSQSAREHLASCLAQGERSLKGIVRRGRFARVDCPPEHMTSLVNINCPEDLALLGVSGGSD